MALRPGWEGRDSGLVNSCRALELAAGDDHLVDFVRVIGDAQHPAASPHGRRRCGIEESHCPKPLV